MYSVFEVKNILMGSLTTNNKYLFKESLTIVLSEIMSFRVNVLSYWASMSFSLSEVERIEMSSVVSFVYEILWKHLHVLS